MYIEFRHLRTIKAIHEAGGVSKAADRLNITQSAISHQIKGLEDQAGVELLVRRSKPMKLSSAGIRLLRTAEKILPEIEALQVEFEDVDVDIRPGLAFDALPALQKEEVDIVISSDPETLPDIAFTPLFEYEPVFVASSLNPLSKKPFIEAEDFRSQTLITYPVERTRLDVFNQLLIPNKVEPASIRQIELTAVILLLVASNRGVSVLPDWVVREVKYSSDYITKPLTDKGLTRRLYAASRSPDLKKPFFVDLIKLAGEEAQRLQAM
jgi:LysR family transcriptional regulator for metE and metH